MKIGSINFAYQISNNLISNKNVFKIIEEIEAKDSFRFIAMLTNRDENKIDPPLNMNIFPYYSSDEFKRNVYSK